MQLLSVKQFHEQYLQLDGSQVIISGWVRGKRLGKTMGFLEISDGTCMQTIQAVLDMSRFPDFTVGFGACVLIHGTLTVTPQAQQDFEIAADTIDIMGDSASDYPLQKKRHSNEYLRTLPHLRPEPICFLRSFVSVPC